jgi:hypothetical protein
MQEQKTKVIINIGTGEIEYLENMPIDEVIQSLTKLKNLELTGEYKDLSFYIKSHNKI